MKRSAWKYIVSSINSSLNNDPKSIEDINKITTLNESTIRGFLPLTNAKELIIQGKTMYIINSQPKKLPYAQLIRILLEVSDKLDNKKYLSANEIFDKIHDFDPELKRDNVTAQVYQLQSRGILDRRGFAGSYTYCLSSNPVKREKGAAQTKCGNMADQLIAIAEFVEKSEVKQLELEKENIRLNKELYEIKGKLKSLLGD